MCRTPRNAKFNIIVQSAVRFKKFFHARILFKSILFFSFVLFTVDRPDSGLIGTDGLQVETSGVRFEVLNAIEYCITSVSAAQHRVVQSNGKLF